MARKICGSKPPVRSDAAHRQILCPLLTLLIPRSHSYCLSLPLCLEWYNGLIITPWVHNTHFSMRCQVQILHCGPKKTSPFSYFSKTTKTVWNLNVSHYSVLKQWIRIHMPLRRIRTLLLPGTVLSTGSIGWTKSLFIYMQGHPSPWVREYVYFKPLSGVGYVSTNLSHSIQWFNTLIPWSRPAGSAAYTVFVWSRLSAPMELLSTHYTTPDTGVEIGSTSATVEQVTLTGTVPHGVTGGSST